MKTRHQDPPVTLSFRLSDPMSGIQAELQLVTANTNFPNCPATLVRRYATVHWKHARMAPLTAIGLACSEQNRSNFLSDRDLDLIR